MPKLKDEYIDKEVKRVMSNIPVDQVEKVDTYERFKMIFQTAFDLGWREHEGLMRQES